MVHSTLVQVNDTLLKCPVCAGNVYDVTDFLDGEYHWHGVHTG